jgi:signal peptidase I
VKTYSIIKDVALTVISLLLVIPVLIYGFPFLVGADGSYTVMSGSMSPALRPGDIVIVTEAETATINVGDILTVESEDFTYTHRVVERLDGGRFRLKGDVNEEPDQNLVEASQIVGRVVLVFPFSHLYTPYGFASALLIPAALIIGKQTHLIYQFTKRRSKRERKKWRRKSSQTVDTSTLLFTIIFIFSTTRIMAPHFLGCSGYFSDVEFVGGIFHVGVWQIGALVDIDPDTLNLGSNGTWVTVYAYIETEYDEKDINIGTVKLDDAVQAEWGEVQDDGRLMVKFDRIAVIEHLIEEGYGDGDEATLTVSGRFMDGTRFTGEDTIRVVDNG